MRGAVKCTGPEGLNGDLRKEDLWQLHYPA